MPKEEGKQTPTNPSNFHFPKSLIIQVTEYLELYCLASLYGKDLI